MRAPRFWDSAPDAPTLRARLLAPLGKLTAMVTARRVAKTADYTASIPVICVGNLNAGGTGKTPTVIAVLQLLSGMGITAHVVSRGYGGSLTGPVAVDPRTHTADQIRWATNLCFWPRSRLFGCLVTEPKARKPPKLPVRRRLSWMTVSRTQVWPRISRSSLWMPSKASGTGGVCPQGHCANLSPLA